MQQVEETTSIEMKVVLKLLWEQRRSKKNQGHNVTTEHAKGIVMDVLQRCRICTEGLGQLERDLKRERYEHGMYGPTCFFFRCFNTVGANGRAPIEVEICQWEPNLSCGSESKWHAWAWFHVTADYRYYNGPRLPPGHTQPIRDQDTGEIELLENVSAEIIDFDDLYGYLNGTFQELVPKSGLPGLAFNSTATGYKEDEGVSFGCQTRYQLDQRGDEIDNSRRVLFTMTPRYEPSQEQKMVFLQDYDGDESAATAAWKRIVRANEGINQELTTRRDEYGT